MMLADVNVLIYAFRKDVPQHAVCRPWLDGGVGRRHATFSQEAVLFN